jgi:putative ABC transport system substrate-binding protein
MVEFQCVALQASLLEYVSIVWRLHAVELARPTPDAIVAYTLPMALMLKQVTTTIPIVMAGGGDPVTGGLVSNFARPGGNITGFTLTEPSLGGKWRRRFPTVLAPGFIVVLALVKPLSPPRDLSGQLICGPIEA